MKKYVVFDERATSYYSGGLIAGKRYEVFIRDKHEFVMDEQNDVRNVALFGSIRKGWAKYVTNSHMENK